MKSTFYSGSRLLFNVQTFHEPLDRTTIVIEKHLQLTYEIIVRKKEKREEKNTFEGRKRNQVVTHTQTHNTFRFQNDDTPM